MLSGFDRGLTTQIVKSKNRYNDFIREVGVNMSCNNNFRVTCCGHDDCHKN